MDSRKQRNAVILGLYQNDRITTVCQNVRILQKWEKFQNHGQCPQNTSQWLHFFVTNV